MKLQSVFRSETEEPSPKSGALSLMASAAMGQGLMLLVTPWLTRIYGPAAFGAFTLVTSIALVMAAGLSGKLEFAIPLPEKDRDARNLLDIAFALSATLTILFSALFWWNAEFIEKTFQAENLGRWISFVPACAFVVATFSILNQWAIRLRRYTQAAARNLVQATGTAAGQLAAGVAGCGAGGLLVGFGFGQLLGAATLAPLLRGTGHRATARERLTLAAPYKRFLIYLAPSGVVNALTLYIPVPVIAAQYGVVEAGLYGLTARILNGPLGVLGIAAGQVYSAELARSVRTMQGSPRRLFLKASAALGLAGATFAIIVALIAPWAFGVIFGAEWTRSGDLARITAAFVAIQLVVSPIVPTLSILGRVRTQAIWEVLRFITVALSLALPTKADQTLEVTLTSYAAAGLLCYLSAWSLCLRAVTPSGRHAE